jgi:aconitate hydratase
MTNPFDAERTLESSGKTYRYWSLAALKEQGIGHVEKLPYSIRVLLESCLRNVDGEMVLEDHVTALANYDAKDVAEQEIAFSPGRVILQDFTGVPAVVDLAALRSAMQRWDGDVEKVNPLSRADLVIDHSVQVDAYGSDKAMGINRKREFERNKERYEFLKWGANSFDNFMVIPPETGIVHQVNLEYLAGVALVGDKHGDDVVYPDSLVGTDSHTTMINGLGVVGWGVGGIEAEAGMLGQPVYMLIPEVVGFELTGELTEGSTATDLVLTVTQMLRRHGVVGKFVEFYGPGLDNLTLADRATIANMAPEYGATMGFFPVDDNTLDYLDFTARDPEHIDLVRDYFKANLLWRDDDADIEYASQLSLDLGEVQPSLAGPTLPQDRILLTDMQGDFNLLREKTYGHEEKASVEVTHKGETFDLADGDIVIAAITSCTNTSNPAVMVGAGLLAKKANELGLKTKPWVKTSLAPGSRVVTDYLDKAELSQHLDAIGFYTVGYGCTTCIGNSGPLDDPIREAIEEGDLVATSVLSGNRNFEGRVSPHTKGNYLASPILVTAYALAGTVDIDLQNDPLGQDKDGNDIFLKDIWPSNQEIHDTIQQCVTKEQFQTEYANIEGPQEWKDIAATESKVYDWPKSTYVQEPPFFVDMPREAQPIKPIRSARVLGLYPDSTTTDHISPAGVIPEGPAADYLREHGVERRDFNSFGSRRGNDQVMTRGTFANIRIKNKLAEGKQGGYTKYLGPNETPDGPFPGLHYESDADPQHGEVCWVYDAAVKYMKNNIDLVVLGGKDYGMGSSRDWAAKGTILLGVKAVIVTSYERIHRSNLIGMGVLPLEFPEGEDADSLGLDGTEVFDIEVTDDVEPLGTVPVTATRENGETIEFDAVVRLDTPVEVEYYRNGGILHAVLRRMAEEG